jgi:hypothetical protein
MYLFLVFAKRQGDFPGSITFNGSAPTQLASTGTARGGAIIYGVLYPPSGSRTVQWTNTGNPADPLLVYQIQVSLGNTITAANAQNTYTTASLTISGTPNRPDNLVVSAAGSYYAFVDPKEKTGATILYSSSYHVVCYKTVSGSGSVSFGYESAKDGYGWGATLAAITGLFGKPFQILGYPGL